jgi:hypothetical protein
MGQAKSAPPLSPIEAVLKVANFKNLDLASLPEFLSSLGGKENESKVLFMITHLIGKPEEVMDVIHKLPEETKQWISGSLPLVVQWVSKGQIKASQVENAGPRRTIKRLLRFLRSEKSPKRALSKFVKSFDVKPDPGKEL